MKKSFFIVLITLYVTNAMGAVGDNPIEIMCHCKDGSTVYPGQTCPDGYKCPLGGITPIETCTSDTCTNSEWTASGAGYQKRTLRGCVQKVCVDEGTEYRCAANYYGTSTNGTSGCSPCPSSGKSVVGSTAITSCYLPSGTSFSDSAGSGTYTADCYY